MRKYVFCIGAFGLATAAFLIWLVQVDPTVGPSYGECVLRLELVRQQCLDYLDANPGTEQIREIPWEEINARSGNRMCCSDTQTPFLFSRFVDIQTLSGTSEDELYILACHNPSVTGHCKTRDVFNLALSDGRVMSIQIPQAQYHEWARNLPDATPWPLPKPFLMLKWGMKKEKRGHSQ
jgi:hypothetical protein